MKKCILTIDIGNTNIVAGIFHREHLIGDFRFTTKKMTKDESGLLLTQAISLIDDDFKIIGIAICSVVPSLTSVFDDAGKTFFHVKPILVTSETNTGITICYKDPKQVGSDRIVNASAAYEKYKCSVIIVDFGTATTIDVVSKKGEYLGGAIAPGIETSSEELFRRAAKLFKVEIVKPANAIGKTTEESLRSGVYYGTIGQVDGLVRRIKKELKNKPKVIATGGLCKFIADDSETIDTCEPFLTLEGLYRIYKRNSKIKNHP